MFVNITRKEYIAHKPCRTTFFDAHCIKGDTAEEDRLIISDEDAVNTVRYIAIQSRETLLWLTVKGILPISLEEAKRLCVQIRFTEKEIERELATVSAQDVAAQVVSDVPEGMAYSDAHGAVMPIEALNRTEAFTEPAEEVTVTPAVKETPEHFVYSDAHGGMVDPSEVVARPVETVKLPCCACDGEVHFATPETTATPTFFHTMPFCSRFESTNTPDQVVQYMKDCLDRQTNHDSVSDTEPPLGPYNEATGSHDPN